MESVRELLHETSTTRWELAMRRPAPHLRSHLGELCGYRETSSGPARQTQFPWLGVAVIFDFGDLRIVDDGQATHHRGGFVAGLGDRFAVTEHDGRSQGLQVNLRPLAARRILGIPMTELTNRIVTFDDLAGPAHRGLSGRLVEASGWDRRFDLVEAFVTERMVRAPAVPSVVAWALDRIERSRGAIDIRGLARETGFSQKHLIDLFKVHVGLSPKRVARLVRFDAVIRYLKAGGRAEWGEVAHRFGYFDQSHLNREIRYFTGGTPTEARRAMSEVGTSSVNSVQAGHLWGS